MPARTGGRGKRRKVATDWRTNEAEQLDITVTEIGIQLNEQCQAIQNNAVEFVGKLRAAFAAEGVKLPSKVKEMPMREFSEKYGCDLAAVLANHTAAAASRAHAAVSRRAAAMTAQKRPRAATGTAVKPRAPPAAGNAGGGNTGGVPMLRKTSGMRRRSRTPARSPAAPRTPGLRRGTVPRTPLGTPGGARGGIAMMTPVAGTVRSGSVAPQVSVELSDGTALTAEQLLAAGEGGLDMTVEAKEDARAKLALLQDQVNRMMSMIGK